MATVNLIDDSRPANYARAVILPTPGDTGPNVFPADNPVNDTAFEALQDVLDARFLQGGSTTWERPAATGS